MHDPDTVAFDIKSPFKRKGSDYRNTLLTIWHRDAQRPGFGYCDDTCGWFPRAHHGDPLILAEIVRRFTFDWDSTWTMKEEDHDPDDGPYEPHTYCSGLFTPDGDPRLSVEAITLQLFFTAAVVVFNSNGSTNWKRAKRFMEAHLFDILFFANNLTDGLHDTITRKYEKKCGETQTPSKREDRIASMAACIYGWILRAERPWYKHPRWHVIHWRMSKGTFAGWHFPVPFRGWYFQFHPWQTLRRWLFDRCATCGKGFKWGESPTTNTWHSREPRWFRSQTDVHHGDCLGGHACANTEKAGC